MSQGLHTRTVLHLVPKPKPVPRTSRGLVMLVWSAVIALYALLARMWGWT